MNLKNSKFLFLVALYVFLSNSTSLAQDTKDFSIIKAPAIEYNTPGGDDILYEEDDEGGNAPSYESTPFKEANPLAENSDSVSFEDEDGELSVVEVNEQINLDSIWVTIAQYYAIWDSRTINPYKIDGANYKDSTSFLLFDSANAILASMPLDYSKINSRFGMRSYRWHYGTDLGLAVGDPVRSVFDGIVRIVQYDAKGYGRYILIRHVNGLETLYGHLSAANVTVGQLVKAGEVIGKGGSTGRSSGPHLHFEVRYEGNAFNPEVVFDFINHTVPSGEFKLIPSHFNYLKEARKVYYHSVKSGETLGSVSRKYKVSISTLCKLNRISTKTILRVGRKLRIR